VQVDVEIPEDVDDGRVQREPKPRVQQITKDATSLSRGRGTVSQPGARPAPTIRFFTSDSTSVLSIWLRQDVYVFAISLATASRLRFGAMSAN
jgi:hypothetical protein